MKNICILGVFVADLAFFGDEIPVSGETVIGKEYIIGPGGKGSNQAVAAAKAGIKTYFISKMGDDQFGQMAKEIYNKSGVDYSRVITSKEHSTGAAGIIVNNRGQNAISVVTGAGGAITKEDFNNSMDIVSNSSVFLTNLEIPVEVVYYSLKKARENNVTTILNPAPASEFSQENFHLVDFFTPNETETAFFVKQKVESKDDAKQAAEKLLDMGIKNVVITLGEKGAYYANSNEHFHVDAINLGDKVIDTTGAGDAFNAGFAVALTEGKSIKESIIFANATAGLSTTKIGTAKSMPLRSEIDDLL